MIARSGLTAPVLVLAGLLATGSPGVRAQDLSGLRPRLARALADENHAEVRALVAEALSKLGGHAGEPEVPDRFEPIPKGVAWLTRDEVPDQLQRGVRWLRSKTPWTIGVDPADLRQPLRATASHLQACLAFARMDPVQAPECLELARKDAAFLMWAQEQGGAGLFPFPAVRHGKGPAFEAAGRFLARAESQGRLAHVVRNGWLIRDDGDGGLQFDNGECGVALLALYETTHEPRYLESARRAVDWALACPLVPNWNYNSFSVYLLARGFEATTNQSWLAAAARKARLGILPGQLTSGPRVGRWLDPHNARPAYHYILLRALAGLAPLLPEAHPDRAPIVRALVLGLQARNPDFLGQGAPNRDSAMEAVLLALRALGGEAALLQASQTEEALQALASLVSDEARRGKAPLGPHEWALFLEHTLRHAAPAAGRSSAPSIPSRRH